MPSKAIKKCVNILCPSLKHIDVEVDVVKDIKINGYITLYQQVILTIITNSLDTFVLQNIQKPKIYIQVNEKDSKSYISITDNAKGIKSEILSNIFDLYFSTKEDKKVSGLGLYIAKQIIEKNMDGKITAQNYDDGVRFSINV